MALKTASARVLLPKFASKVVCRQANQELLDYWNSGISELTEDLDLGSVEDVPTRDSRSTSGPRKLRTDMVPTMVPA